MKDESHNAKERVMLNGELITLMWIFPVVSAIIGPVAIGSLYGACSTVRAASRAFVEFYDEKVGAIPLPQSV